MAIIRLKQPAYPGAGFIGGGFGKNVNMFENEMNRLFHKFFGSDLTTAHSNVFPPVNIYQDNANIYLTAELPGMETSEVTIDIEQDSIQIQGERKIENEGENLSSASKISVNTGYESFREHSNHEKGEFYGK